MDVSIYPVMRRAVRPEGFPAHSARDELRMAGRLRRSTLVILRWAAIIGQSLAMLFVALGLGYSFPVWPSAIVIGTSALVNLLVTIALPLDRRVGDLEAAAQLGFDLLALAILLWLTGGMTNPFALLFVAPVVTSEQR